MKRISKFEPSGSPRPPNSWKKAGAIAFAGVTVYSIHILGISLIMVLAVCAIANLAIRITS